MVEWIEDGAKLLTIMVFYSKGSVFNVDSVEGSLCFGVEIVCILAI